MANNTDNPKDGKPGSGPSRPAAVNKTPMVETKPSTIKPAARPGTRPQNRSVPVADQQISRRMAARYQSDLKRQRQLIYAALVIVVLVVLVFAVGIYQTLIGPNIQTLASYGGVNVNSGDYYTYRKIVLYKELGQLQNISGSQAGDQQQQIQTQIQSVSYEITNIQSSPIDQPTLERLVSNMLLEREAKNQFGITISDAELNTGLTNDFALYTPTPQADQAKSTQTANVVATASGQQATQTASVVTALPTDTPVRPSLPPDVAARGTAVALTKAAGGTVTDTVASGTPGVTVSPAGTPGVTVSPASAVAGTGTPAVAGTATSVVQNTAAGTPAATSGTPGPTAVSSPTVSSTTTPATATVAPTQTALPADKANGTVQARQDGTLQSLKDSAGISQDDYKKYWIKPQLLQQKVTAKLISQLPLPGQNYNNLQIHVSHILVNDEQTAKDIEAKLQAATDKPTTFAQLARQYDAQTDKTAAAHNGDLGWAIKGQFVDPFWTAAIKLTKGQISDPVHTQFGWHIIQMLDRKDNGPMELTVYNALTDQSQGDAKIYTNWLNDQVTAAKVTYNTPPTPTPSPSPLPTAIFTPVVPPTATVEQPTQAIPTSSPAPGSTPGVTAAANGTVVGSPAAVTAGTTAVGATTSGTTATTTTVAATTTTDGTTATTTTTAFTPTVSVSSSAAATPTTK